MEQLEFAFEYSERPQIDLTDFIESSLEKIDKAFGSFSLQTPFEQLEFSLWKSVFLSQFLSLLQCFKGLHKSA